MTPAMQQYVQIKSDYPDHIVLFRMGDFYETFYDDAKNVSVILGITLTARDREKKVPMAGIPYHALDNYLTKLIDANQKIVLVEQLEDPKKAQGIVKRGIVKIFTPGTTFDRESRKNNFLFCIFKNQEIYEVAFSDISEGIIYYAEFESFTDLINNLVISDPKEIIYSQNNFEEKEIKSIKSNLKKSLVSSVHESYFTNSEFTKEITDSLLKKVQKTNSKSIKGLLNYFVQTQRTKLGHINELRVYGIRDFMKLDASVISSLEIFEGQRQDAIPLIKILDFTSTGGGSRLLRKWLATPLIDVNKIQSRQNKIYEIRNLGKDNIQKNQRKLSQIYDLNRIATKIGLKTANARDLRNLVDSVKSTFTFIEELKRNTNLSSFSEYIEIIESEIKKSQKILSEIHNTLTDFPPITVREGGMIKSGISAELDELYIIKNGGKEWLSEFEKSEIKRTNINTLKVRFNKVFGYYIEVSKGQSVKVPDEYIRKQTLVNAERYITPELKEYEAKVLAAEEKINILEFEIFSNILEKAFEIIPSIQKIYQIISEFDVIHSLAYVSINEEWTLPEVADNYEIIIENGRHPVVESMLKKDGKLFVKNSFSIDKSSSLQIITGPNMGGKSTFLRQIALIVLLAQIGSFVPADNAKIGIVDRIFARIGASDNLSQGESTFMVEMLESANILTNLSAKSLIILDEVGRGTSTFDGMSIAWAICEFLAQKGCKTIFATHYHELTDLSSKYTNVKNLAIKVAEYNGEIIFLHQIISGRADKSYGIHVAKLAGVPEKVINSAKKVLKILEKEKNKLQPKPQDLFSIDIDEQNTEENNKIIEILKNIDINTTSPIEALQILHELKKQIEK